MMKVTDTEAPAGTMRKWIMLLLTGDNRSAMVDCFQVGMQALWCHIVRFVKKIQKFRFLRQIFRFKMGMGRGWRPRGRPN